jgi:pimeloyl-ACP methyl ester carboxylesterase
MTAVECLAKSGPYWRHVCDGCLTSEPLTGKNTSAGLRATCTIQFTAAQTTTTRTVPRTIRMANGATRKARSARPARRHAAERRARRLRVHVLWSAPREIVTWDMMAITPVCPGRQFPATPTRQHWDGITLEYEVVGAGEPVVLSHGCFIADAFRPLLAVLSVLGGESDALSPRFAETHRALCAWLPHAEAFILPGATHFLQMEKPRDMAAALSAFYRRYPLTV